jgi:hypothetical protein
LPFRGGNTSNEISVSVASLIWSITFIRVQS